MLNWTKLNPYSIVPIALPKGRAQTQFRRPPRRRQRSIGTSSYSVGGIRYVLEESYAVIRNPFVHDLGVGAEQAHGERNARKSQHRTAEFARSRHAGPRNGYAARKHGNACAGTESAEPKFNGDAGQQAAIHSCPKQSSDGSDSERCALHSGANGC